MTIIPKKLNFVTQRGLISFDNQHLPKIIFFLILIIGIFQITVGVGFLFTCRRALQPIPCAFVLKAHPCNGLQAPGYGGILNIVISTFGLSCLEQMPAAIFLLIVSVAEFLAGLQFLCARPIFFKDYFKIPTANDICKNHGLQPGKLSLCWRNLQQMYPSCHNHTDQIQISCYEANVDYIPSPSSALNFTDSKNQCAYLINEHVSVIYTSLRHLSGITILLLDVLCILLAVFLIYLHQKQKKIKEMNKIFEQTGILAKTDKNILKQDHLEGTDLHQGLTILQLTK